MTTVCYNTIKWNSYLKNLEFCTLSNKLLTFWRVSTDVSLQYQHLDYNTDEIDGSKAYFTALEYTPPLGKEGIILALVALSNDLIWGVDTKTNCIIIRYLINMGQPISLITCTLNYIILGYQNIIKYYKLPILADIPEDLNLFKSQEQEVVIDSDILSYQTDWMKSNTLVMSRKGTLWCISYEEAMCVKIYSFLDIKDEIIQTKIVHKDYQNYSVKKIDFTKLKVEDVLINPEIKENQYYIISGHKSGIIRIWNLPEYSLNLQFEVITEELFCFDTTPNDLKLVASYSKYLRFFEIAQGRFLGKYKPISSKSFKHICFLPDGQYLFCIDLNNTIYLLKIEKFEPLLIQIHQILNLNGEIYQFRISPIDCYNYFLVNLENIFLYVYERKFTNVIKNLSYDNSVPQFSLREKLNLEEHLKSQFNISNNKNEIVYENFIFEFCTNDKNLIYCLSEGRKVVLIRNFEKQTFIKTISFPYSPINMTFSPKCFHNLSI
jgi:WD40 repeat protein